MARCVVATVTNNPPRSLFQFHHRRLLPIFPFSCHGGSVALSEDARGIVIHMKDTCFLDAKTIAYLTGMPVRTVYHILVAWKKTGEVKPTAEGKQGRPRALDFGDTQGMPDTYLCYITHNEFSF